MQLNSPTDSNAPSPPPSREKRSPENPKVKREWASICALLSRLRFPPTFDFLSGMKGTWGNFSAHNVPHCGFSSALARVACSTPQDTHTNTHTHTHTDKGSSFRHLYEAKESRMLSWILSINGIKYVSNKTGDWNAQVKNFCENAFKRAIGCSIGGRKSGWPPTSVHMCVFDLYPHTPATHTLRPPLPAHVWVSKPVNERHWIRAGSLADYELPLLGRASYFLSLHAGTQSKKSRIFYPKVSAQN